MFSKPDAESAETIGEQLSEAETHLLTDNCHDDAETKAKSNASLGRPGNRVECLDGLRGLACIAVFNYHFFWPWTKSIMLGYGFMPPTSLEPYTNWLSLPIICLLHRGRAMVAIFFAISGYVLCRHIIRSIHDRNWDAVYRNLSSSVFRRIFRLYIPPTISMLLVAILAQTGAFRSETSVYTGVDSSYINGTLRIVTPGHSCPLGMTLSGGPALAKYIGLPSPEPLGNSSMLSDVLCLNVIKRQLGPFELYRLIELLDEQTPELKENATSQDLAPAIHARSVREDLAYSIYYRVGRTNTSLYYADFGGSWEEHPFVHPNVTLIQAVQNFTRIYTEWANPLNFNNYHTTYDPHTYTMPIEFRGSMLIYLFLLGTLGIKTIWRVSLAGAISVYSLVMGRWDMSIFLGATMLSDIDVWNSSDALSVIIDYTIGRRTSKQQTSRRGHALIRWLVFVFALYLLSYPDVGAEYTPGFILLSRLVPRYYSPLARWMFYDSIGALLLIPCIVHSDCLRDLLESRVAQYLGKMSFSIYLVHGPLLHGLGFWIMPRLFERFGWTGGFLVGWVVLFTITMYLAHWWYKKVDVWSMTVGRRIERKLAN
ncbi:hypothetical protein E4U43_000864 [Claviceps pusilla]|uniref:Acyltransferase 3 domain-containing protein n=1 Tax=Claviceps pusilla TaxID=123648 RepID=A0A9P7N8V0_9HYPO|nr:hypothetical protein E4U43_000864 [Claviceps pusilla]